MALGKRRQKQTSFWVETSQLQVRGRHPFYSRLNEILDRAKFDTYAERICRKYYATTMGRPSIAPGVYFRCFLMGYFEGIDSERGIAYRVSDSLSLREFLGLSLEEQTPDHSTLSKTRRMMNLGTHQAVFRWVLKRLAAEGLLSGKNLGVDATTLEANAALKSIVRRDGGARYDEHVTELMKSEGIEEPTPAERQRFDRKRKKSLSNRDWVNPHDREARITKMKDGRTHLAYKAEHAVDMETGAVVALTVQPADRGDTASMPATLSEAGCTVTEMAGQAAPADAVGPVETVSEVGVERVVADKGYHSKQVLQELIERSFAHLYDTGGMRRVHLRGKNNIAKRALIHAAAFNLSLILRQMLRVGTARQAADLFVTFWLAFVSVTQTAKDAPPVTRASLPLDRAFRKKNRCQWSPLQIETLSTGC